MPAETPDELLARLTSLTVATETMLLEAVQNRDRIAASRLIREYRENIVALGRAQGMWQTGPTIQISDDRRVQQYFAGLTDAQLDAVILRGEQAALPGGVIESEVTSE